MSGPRSPPNSKLSNGVNSSTNTNGHADEFKFDSMEDALGAFARGEFLVVMDDEGRENEGDLIIAASHCTTEKMAWMIKHTRCVSLYLAWCVPSLNTENLKRLHLHYAPEGETRGAGNPNDGS